MHLRRLVLVALVLIAYTLAATLRAQTAPRLRCRVEPATIFPGQSARFVVEGDALQPAARLDLLLAYSPEQVQVQDQDPQAPEVNLALGPALAGATVLTNTVDSIGGEIRLVVTRTATAATPLSGTLATAQLLGVVDGLALFTFRRVSLLDADDRELAIGPLENCFVAVGNVDTPTPTATPTDVPQSPVETPTATQDVSSPLETPSATPTSTSTPPPPTATPTVPPPTATDTPTPTDTPTTTPSPTLTETPTVVISTPTPAGAEPADEPPPETSTPTPLPSPAAEPSPTDTPTPAPTETPTPTATPMPTATPAVELPTDTPGPSPTPEPRTPTAAPVETEPEVRLTDTPAPIAQVPRPLPQTVEVGTQPPAPVAIVGRPPYRLFGLVALAGAAVLFLAAWFLRRSAP